jgi:predicted Zn-dependent peptidase
MSDNLYTTHTLANGLRMVHVRTHSPVAWCGLAVNAGSRDDGEGQYGLAHFVEHTIFKGTTHRRSWHIINRMESIGGELNAYTTKEHTMVYSVFPAEHLARAVELLADLVCCSTFPHDEIERERDVVLEEADSYRDTPGDAVYDDVEDILFAGSALGHNILGVEEHLRGLGSEHCMNYLKSLYVPDNMVFFVVGNMAPERAFKLAERHMGAMDCPLQRLPREVPPINAPSRHTVDMHLHQAHTVVAMRLPSMYSEERFALSLLNNILGGPGMNSLLNVQLRERRGYVYTVESTISLMSDCGMIQIYMGCDPSDIRSSLRVIDRVTHDLASDCLAERRLDAAKRQYCGQLLLAADSAEWMAMSAGRNMLCHGQVTTLDEMVECITSVTPEQVRHAAEHITLENATILTMQ